MPARFLKVNIYKGYSSGSGMWNEPTIEELSKLPSIAEIRRQNAGDRLIYMHFTGYHKDWYIAGFDPESQMLYGCVATRRPRGELAWGSRELSYFFNYREPTGQGAVELTRNMSWGPPMRAYDPCGPIWPVEERQRARHMKAKQERQTDKKK